MVGVEPKKAVNSRYNTSMSTREQRLEHYAENLPEDKRNPKAKEAFDALMIQASESVEIKAPSKQEKPEHRDGYKQK